MTLLAHSPSLCFFNPFACLRQLCHQVHLLPSLACPQGIADCTAPPVEFMRKGNLRIKRDVQLGKVNTRLLRCVPYLPFPSSSKHVGIWSEQGALVITV